MRSGDTLNQFLVRTVIHFNDFQVSKSAYVESIRQLLHDLVRELVVVQHGSLDTLVAACQNFNDEDKLEKNVKKILQILSNGWYALFNFSPYIMFT